MGVFVGYFTPVGVGNPGIKVKVSHFVYLAKIHNGFWFWKYCFLTGLLILYFYIINIEEIDELRESMKTFLREFNTIFLAHNF